jgi:AmmeMemoRadiSam system protein B/AmmeMemoRadiSam system protein A
MFRLKKPITWITLIFLIYASVALSQEVKKSVIAGSWYPDDKIELEKMINKIYVQAPTLDFYGEVLGLIVPHAGYQYSGAAAVNAYAALANQDIKRVIIMGPTHHIYFKGASILKVKYYETPLGKVELDQVACQALLQTKEFTSNKAAHAQEHSVEIQLPLLQHVLKDFKIIPIVVGELDKSDYEKIADNLRSYMDDYTIIIASSDFTHFGRRFGYMPFKDNFKENVQKLDFGALDKILHLDPDGFLQYIDQTKATICGNRAIALLLKILGKNCYAQLINYYTSGDLMGNYEDSVSYASVCFTKKREELNQKEKNVLLKLARDTLVTYLNKQKLPEINLKEYNINPRLIQNQGVFVTINKKGQLRGCIGYIKGQAPIYQAVVRNTINAATRDPRFYPMNTAEIKDVTIEISIMSPLKKIDSLDEIKVGTHGLYLVKGENSGILLPQVPGQYGWDKKTFLEQLSNKAGLAKNAYKEGADIFIFSAQVFGEKEH